MRAMLHMYVAYTYTPYTYVACMYTPCMHGADMRATQEYLATRDISAGEMLTFSYVGAGVVLRLPTSIRQVALQGSGLMWGLGGV